MRRLAYCLADTHIPEDYLGGAWKDLEGVSGDALFALDQVVSLCCQESADLLIAGDIFDGPDVDPRQLAETFRVLRPLEKNGLSIFYVLGNHDRNHDWLAALGPSAVRLDGRVVNRKDGVSYAGMSWKDPSAFSVEIQSVKPADVGLYHQTWAEWVGNPAGISVASLPPNRLAVCGDIHVRGIVQPNTGPALALSPGALTPQNTLEFVDSVVYALNPDFTLTTVELKSRNMLRVDIDSPETAERCLKLLSSMSPDVSLPEHLARPVLSVRLTGAVNDFVSAARALAEENGVVLKVSDVIPSKERVKSNPATNNVTPVGGSVGLIDAINNSDAPLDHRSLAVSLVADGVVPDEVLRGYRTAFEASRGEPAGQV